MFKSDEIAIASVIDKYIQTINNADTTLTTLASILAKRPLGFLA